MKIHFASQQQSLQVPVMSTEMNAGNDDSTALELAQDLQQSNIFPTTVESSNNKWLLGGGMTILGTALVICGVKKIWQPRQEKTNKNISDKVSTQNKDKTIKQSLEKVAIFDENDIIKPIKNAKKYKEALANMDHLVKQYDKYLDMRSEDFKQASTMLNKLENTLQKKDYAGAITIVKRVNIIHDIFDHGCIELKGPTGFDDKVDKFQDNIEQWLHNEAPNLSEYQQYKAEYDKQVKALDNLRTKESSILDNNTDWKNIKKLINTSFQYMKGRAQYDKHLTPDQYKPPAHLSKRPEQQFSYLEHVIGSKVQFDMPNAQGYVNVGETSMIFRRIHKYLKDNNIQTKDVSIINSDNYEIPLSEIHEFLNNVRSNAKNNNIVRSMERVIRNNIRQALLNNIPIVGIKHASDGKVFIKQSSQLFISEEQEQSYMKQYRLSKNEVSRFANIARFSSFDLYLISRK